MAGLILLFANNILPIVLIAGAGFVLARFGKMEPRPLSQTVFYLFSPCLLFNALTHSQLDSSDMFRMMSFAITIMLICGLLAFLAGKALGLDRSLLAAVIVPAMLMNAGNYGLPLVDFAFGKDALAHASLFYVSMSLLSYSLGTLIASMGTTGLRQSLINMLKIPTLYAALLALVFANQGWNLPLPISRTVELMANATIPTMLVVLGMQLQAARWTGQFKALTAAVSVRMLAAPAAAFLLSPYFGLSGPAFQAGMLESAMPSAVLTIVLATEYQAQPAFVTFVVLVSTLLSPLTLTPLMYLLGASTP